jgi:prepilin-type N-terminal cleavage/methylation domain-containing protein
MFLRTDARAAANGLRGRDRRGFSLVELLVVMVMLSIIGFAIVNTMVRQQRFFRGAGEVMNVRGQMRHAIDMLTSELRGISAAGGDVYAGTMTSTSVEFRSNIGSSIACRIPVTTQIYLPPNSDLAAGHRLTFLGQRPLVGNGVFILDNGATDAAEDDVWQLRKITAVADAVNPCTGTSYTGVGDATKTGLLLTLNAALPASVVQGAIVRLVQRVRYGLYVAGDGRTYLGYCNSSDIDATCNVLQPAAGPFRVGNADDAAGTSGLNFYYYDENGAVTADRLLVARIDIAVRGISSNWVSRGGEAAKGLFTDTARVVVGLRNRR